MNFLFAWILHVGLFILIFPTGLLAQIDDSLDYSSNHLSDTAIVAAHNFSQEEISFAKNLNLLASKYFHEGDYKNAIDYFEKVKNDLNNTTNSRAIASFHLGYFYLAFGDVERSNDNLKNCLSFSVSEKIKKKIVTTMYKFGLDSLYQNWVVLETSHFVFHFQNASEQEISTFMFKKEFAFDSINNFFRASLPKKIDYFVWKNTQQAKKLLGQKLAFTLPAMCITHTTLDFTLGHEMTHSIFHFAAQSKNYNKLIVEGTAVYFDMAKKYSFEKLKSKTDSTDSVIKIWTDPVNVNHRILYPLGGELVKRLITQFGREKYLKFIKDQSYENARKIYGKKLEKLIANLQRDLLPLYIN